MNLHKIKSLFKLVVFLTATTLSGPAFAHWVQQLTEASTEKRFTQPSADEITRAQALFLRLLKNESGDEIKASWSALGFDLISSQDDDLMLLIEKPRQRSGRGFFVFRKSGTSALQVPHAFKDEMTRKIGIALFQQGHFSAAAWNTVPRNFILNGSNVDADMAHLTDTYFIAFSRAFAQRHPEGSILQLHGFAQGKRRHPDAKKADAILSNGTSNPPVAVKNFASCLTEKSGKNILTYPEDTRELGATTNTIAAALRSKGFNRFFHFEMSREMRADLQQNTSLQRTVLQCFEAVK